jgi:hypothetical protein
MSEATSGVQRIARLTRATLLAKLHRHCERSEAIQKLLAEALDCFVASLLAVTKSIPQPTTTSLI